MKLKEVLYLLGLKQKTKTYGHRVDRFQLEKDGEVEFANWEHPHCAPKSVTQEGIDALREFLKPGDSAIDIGAHIGDTTVPIALAVGGKGCVFGFEPNPKVYQILKVNAGLNLGQMRIIPLPYAASENSCKLTFTYSDSGLCNGGEHRGLSRWKHAHAFEIEVDGLNAEKLLREQYPDEVKKLKYVKTDAEGGDLYVLQSIAGLIDEFRPFIRSEVYKHTTAEQRRDLFQFFLERGYSVYEYEEAGPTLKGKALSLEDVQQAAHYDIFAVPPQAVSAG